MLIWIFITTVLFVAEISGRISSVDTPVQSLKCALNSDSIQKFQYNEKNKAGIDLSSKGAAVKNGALECFDKIDDEDSDICKKFNHSAHILNLPTSPMIETPELRTLLELILVDWLTPPIDMMSTPDGRALLKAYGKDARTTLNRALNSYNNNTQFLRWALRTLWSRISQKNFDASVPDCPYSQHRYIMDYETPAKDYEERLFSSNSESRDPPASSEEIDEILSNYDTTSFGKGEYDVFDMYKKNGMSKSQVYLEKRIHQFYQILFFFHAMREENDFADQNDVPIEKISKNVQNILWHRETYRTYLHNLRKRLTKALISAKNYVVENLLCTSRPYEEDMWHLINSPSTSSETSDFITTTTIRSTTTTTSNITTSTTAKPSKKGKKGKLYVNHCGRHFINVPPSEFPEKCCMCEKEKKEWKAYNSQKRSVNLCMKNQYDYSVANSEDPVLVVCSMICEHHRQQFKQIMENAANYGYIIYTGTDENYKSFSKEEFSSLSKILHNL